MSNLQLPVHAPVVEVNREISADEVVESHNVVPAASQNNSRHAVFEQIIRDHRPAQLVIEVPFAPFNSHRKRVHIVGVCHAHSLHRRPPQRPPICIPDVPESDDARIRPEAQRVRLVIIMRNSVAFCCLPSHVAGDDVAAGDPGAAGVPASER